MSEMRTPLPLPKTEKGVAMTYTKNWFSNMLDFDKPLEFDGLSFRTPEHFFQAMKATNRHTRALIASATTSFEAKRLGRRVHLRPHWHSEKYEIMAYAQKYRFRSGTEWRKKLLATAGPIVEWNNWHDNEWGHCTCTKCKPKQKRNLLGTILTEMRDALAEACITD